MTTEATNKRCVVSLATKNSRYVDGLARLSNSLRDNASDIDFLGFVHERSVGAPLHTEHPYAFKMYAIQRAIDAGYTKILWLDCSVWAVAPIHSIFDLIKQDGYFFTENGCVTGEWTNDKTLEYFNLDRNMAMDIPMVQAGFMGFNMLSTGGYIFHRLDSYQDLFHGAWSNADKTESEDLRCLGHRHEQSVLSCILYDLGGALHRRPAKIQPAGTIVQYGGKYDKQLNDSIILRCQGL